MILKNSFLYAINHINNSMSTHYEKYKDTIKKVARRNYRKRGVWLNNLAAVQSCIHCGRQKLFV